jgi:tetratricopeptide (TPR) repeat protein
MNPSSFLRAGWGFYTKHLRPLVRVATVSFVFVGCGQGVPITPQGRHAAAINDLEKAPDEQRRFYALGRAAKESFVAGNVEDARKYANELMALLPKYPKDWNYGNAIQDSNLVLGRIAVKEGRIEDAKKHLLAAGQSPGSPQMNSFGPNMSLALDLLKLKEKDVVLEYFDSCRRFWKMHADRLDQWSKEVKAGQIPDFGANLLY